MLDDHCDEELSDAKSSLVHLVRFLASVTGACHHAFSHEHNNPLVNASFQ